MLIYNWDSRNFEFLLLKPIQLLQSSFLKLNDPSHFLDAAIFFALPYFKLSAHKEHLPIHSFLHCQRDIGYWLPFFWCNGLIRIFFLGFL